jgi:hypothetical protein
MRESTASLVTVPLVIIGFFMLYAIEAAAVSLVFGVAYSTLTSVPEFLVPATIINLILTIAFANEIYCALQGR